MAAPTVRITVRTATRTVAFIVRPVQDEMVPQAVNGGAVHAGAGSWGIDGAGRAYFDGSGAAPTEHAVLVGDDTGDLHLVPHATGDLVLLENGRLHRRRVYAQGSHVRYALPL